jgi:hypothetical protein
LRRSWPAGVPVITQAAEIIAGYLAAEQQAGRIDPGADVDTLAFMLIGAVHMDFVGRDYAPPDAETVARILAATLGPKGDQIRRRIAQKFGSEETGSART